MPAYLWLLFTVLLPSPPTPTEDGVPYIVSIFAENSAGNGTKCNVTDFTNELGESWYTITKQLQLVMLLTSLTNNTALMSGQATIVQTV